MEKSKREFWRVLHIDDDEDDYLLTSGMLSEAQGRKFVLDWAPTYEAGQERLHSTDDYDAVLVDYDLGPRTGIELIRETTSEGYRAPLILFTGRGSYDVDLEAMEAGATLYLTKTEVNPLLLERSIRYAIERKRIEHERTDLVESIQDGFFAVDKDWQITYINHRAAQSGGFEPEELVGRNIWETFPRLLRTPAEQAYRLVMDERKSVQFEMQGVYAGAWYNVSVYPFHEGISIYWQDITEKKMADVAVRRSEAMYRAIARNLPDGAVVVVDRDMRILIAEGPLLSILGVAPENLEGRTPREAIDLRTAEIIGERLRLAFAGETGSYETEHFGRVVWAQYLPLRDEREQVSAAMVLALDITERTRTEEALRESERRQREMAGSLAADRARLTAVLESLPVGVWIADQHGQLIGKNEQADRIWAGEAPLSDSIANYQQYAARYADSGKTLLPEEYPVAQVLQTGQPVEPVELNIRRFDGTEGTVLVSAAPIKDSEGRLAGAVGVNVDITERKRTEESLRFSEERFSKAFIATPDALVISRLVDGQIEMINNSFERLFGYSRAEVIGKTSLQLNMIARPGDRDEMVERIRTDHSLRDYETDIRIKSGEIRRAALSTELLTIGGDAYILTIIEDITERKRAEDALREQEEMLRLALTAGRAGAWSWDLSTNAVQWSDEYYRIFGFEPGSIRPSVEAGFSRLHPDDLNRVEAVVQEAVERGTQIDEVHRVIWPDGSIHWVRGISQAVDDEQGKPVRIAGIVMDITQQKQAEIELKAAHHRTAEVLESISDAFYSLDQEGRFTYVNQKAASLWGKQPGELIGENIWEVFPFGKETESYRMIQQALAERQPIAYESYSKFLDRWLDVHLYPTEQGISVYFQEITDRKRKEETLANYARELERSNRDLEEFAFVSSHDLQEPLRKIEALGDMILRDSAHLSEQQRDQFARLRQSAGRMRNMVNGLLQLSRLSTQAQPFQPADLHQIAQEVLSDLELEINRTGGVVEVCELPSIQADPVQMQQLLQNLIGNALKFQPPGGKPRIKLFCCQPTPETVQIIIKDNGIGFDQELAGNLFQPFKRLVGRSEYDGSGMGLAISRKIVERHGGEITARSKRGHGAAFIITLPVDPGGSRS